MTSRKNLSSILIILYEVFDLRNVSFRVNVTTGGISGLKRDTAGYLLIYSVKRTQLIGRRPLPPCRVRKTAGYTLPRLLFPRNVLRFSEMYPDLAGSGTLPSAIFSGRITFRSQQRTPKPKSFCSNQAIATDIASSSGRSALLPKNTHCLYSQCSLLNL